MSIFFFVSGYLYNEQDTFRKFAYKKLRGLFVPWLIFSVFNICLSQILSFNSHSDIFTELRWNFLQIRGMGDGLWFIVALFVAFFPFYFLVNLTKGLNRKYRFKIMIGISFGLSIVSVVYSLFMNPTLLPWNSSALPWHVEYIFQAMFYMVLGYLFKLEYEEVLERYNTRANRIRCLVFYLLLIYIPYFADVTMPIVLDVIYQYVSQIFGILCVVSICKMINTNKYISFVGKNTLIYFALHGKVYSLLQTLLKKGVGTYYNMILSNTILSSIFAVVFAVLLSIILIVPAYVINKWFPFVIGRGKRRK